MKISYNPKSSQAAITQQTAANDDIIFDLYASKLWAKGTRIGADWADISSKPSSLKNPHALTISLNGTSQGPYDGSAAKNINITPDSIGAATSGHNHDGRYVRKWTGAYGGANKFLKLVIGEEKGWIRLEVSDSNKALSGGYGIYIIGWGYHGNNGTDTLTVRCLYANDSRYTTALKVVRTSRNNYDFYFQFASDASYPSYTINYSNSITSIDYTVTAISTIPTATWTSSLSALQLNASQVDWSGITNKPSEFNPAAHTHTVFKNNLMIKGTNGISDSASIHLGIGDSDTGFKWISDGKCQIYANNSAVGEWTLDGMNWFKNPTVNGNKVWNAGNDGSGSGLDADLLDGWHLDSIRKNVGYSWLAKYRINNWSRIIKIDNYSNILLAINFSQMYQASNHLYLISTGYGCGNIVQLGANGFSNNSAIKIRLTENTELSYNVEIYSTYGYNGATELSINCNYIRIDGNSTITTYLTYTAGGGTVRKEITSSYSKIVANLQGNSDTTTKLQTPRQINGTNFDGSANITTSYWGTTRTLTIGNSGKSVNGSANISWSLSEIGAADVNHTHDDRYLKLTGGTMAGNALITFADSGSWGTDKGPQGARGGLYWTGQSDYAKLYAEETAGDNLDLVIQFGDDDTNGLSIRNKANTQTSYISASGVITTGTFKGNLDWSYITNKPATATRWPSWAEVTGKPSSFTPSTHTHGLSNSVFFLNMPSISGNAKWKEVFGYPVNYNLLLSVRIYNPAPEWCVGNFGSGILYGGSDTKGFMSSAYNEPLIMWAGGNGRSDDSVPKWYIGIKGIHKSIYNLATIASEANSAYNLRHSHANKSVLDGITSGLVNNWNTAYTFVNTITGTDTDKVINKWDEIVNFLAGITEDNKLNTLLNSKLSVYELADNTNVGTIKNNGIYYSTTDVSSGTLTNSPFNTGFALINMTSYDGGDDLRRSRLAFNANGEIKISDDRNQANTAETWYNVLTSKNSGINGSTIKLNGTSITVYSSSTADGRYVKKTGDTMTGALNFANNTWNQVGDDAAIGDHNVAGCLGIKGLTAGPGLAFYNSSNTLLSKLVGTANQFQRVSGNNIYNILDNSTTHINDNTITINGSSLTVSKSDHNHDGRYLKWLGNAGQSNMNAIGRISHSSGMTNLSDPGNTIDNPMEGGSKSTYWHLYWQTNYSDDPSGSNAWVAQIVNKAGTDRWWVRSRDGGTITNGTNWTSNWRFLVTAPTSGLGSANQPVYINSAGEVVLANNYPTSLKSPYSLTLKANGTILATYDGSSSKEANFTYANVGAASASHTHTYIVAEDHRAKYPGQILDPQRMKLSFLSASTLGIGGNGQYYDVITVRSYRDPSGGSDNALLFSKDTNSLYHTRFAFGSTDSWGNPLLIIDSGNIGSQSVAYATNADTLDNYHANGLLTALSNTNNGISVTVGGTTKSVSNISVNYANSAGSATRVIVNQHTNNDINYPLVWSNQNNANNATENQLFKSWQDLYYNPKNKRLFVKGSVSTANINATGTVTSAGFKHSGVTKNADQYVLTAGGGYTFLNQTSNELAHEFSKDITVTSEWTDIEDFYGGNQNFLTQPGTYIVQVYYNDSSADGMYEGYFSGIMSWFTKTTNSNNADEIVLHRVGHAYANTIYLRTRESLESETNPYTKLQISANTTLKQHTYKFKFKRIC